MILIFVCTNKYNNFEWLINLIPQIEQHSVFSLWIKVMCQFPDCTQENRTPRFIKVGDCQTKEKLLCYSLEN